MSAQRLEPALQWPEMQAPVHVTPHSAHNLETFACMNSSPCNLSMADISQQTRAMGTQLWQGVQGACDHTDAGGDRLPEPLRISGMLSQPVEVEVPSQPVLGADAWRYLGPQPMHQQQPLQAQMTSPMMEGGMTDMEMHRLHAEQQKQHVAQMMQSLQLMAQHHAPTEIPMDDFLRQMAAEISKQCSGKGLDGWGAAAAAGVPQGLPFWGMPWPQQAQGSGTASGEESFSTDKRVEELNHYIRQQAQDYMEGQAEWSRQMAEAKHEFVREIQKVKREKEGAERQARQELLRLQQRLREIGGEDEGACGAEAFGGSEGPAKPAGASAACVSRGDFDQVHRKCMASEDRIRDLEQYIKDQSAKQLLGGDEHVKEKDEEIEKLRQVIMSHSAELRQASSELEALRLHHRQKVLLWEHGANRLLGTVEQFLGQSKRERERGSEGEELETGRFGRTATKLSLTLSTGDGGDVGSLRRLLKDVLKNGKDKGAKRPPQKAKADAQPGRQPPAEAAADEQPRSEEDGKQEDITPWTPGMLGAASAVCSDSDPSSRETSPGPPKRGGFQHMASGPLPNSGGNEGPVQLEQVWNLMSKFANELRQLIALSRSNNPCSAPCATPAESSPRSAGGSVSPSPSPCMHALLSHRRPLQSDEGTHVRQLIDSIGPARHRITQNIIAVEKMLRGLDWDLRRQCEELLGHEGFVDNRQVEYAGVAEGNGQRTMVMDEEEEEVRCHMPLSQENQLRSMTGLCHARQQSSAVLAEFVRLPQPLKMVFDIIKKLDNQVSSFLRQAEAQVLAAHLSERRHAYHVELLQRRVQMLSQKSGLPEQPVGSSALGSEGAPFTPLKEVSEESDEQLAALEIHEELERGIPYEEQLLATRIRLRRMTRSLDGTEEQLKSLEHELVELQFSRYN